MDIDLSKRGVLTLFFRRRKLFFGVASVIIIAAVGYLLMATPLYMASGSILVKFGANAVPNVSRASDSDNRNIGPEEDHTAALESNVQLLQSRSLLRDVINDIGVDTLYPGLTESLDGKDSPVEVAITQIIKKDMTVKIEEQSDIITLSYINQNPDLAATFLNRLIDKFIEHHADFYKKPPTEFLAAQIKEANDKLAVSQKNLREFKEKNGLSSLDTELQELMHEKGDMQSETLKAVDEARVKLSDLQLRERELLNTYRADSKIVEDVRQSIRVAQEQLHALQSDLKTSASVTLSEQGDASTPLVTSQVESINQRIAAIEAKRTAYDDLVRQVQIDEDNYKSYAEHGEQARIADALNKEMMTSISVVDQPVTPMKPSYPKRLIVLLAGLVAAFGAAVWVVIVMEYFDDRLMTPEQVSAQLGVPVLASYVAQPRLIGKV